MLTEFVDKFFLKKNAYHFYSIPKVLKNFSFEPDKVPNIIKIFVENLLRNQNGIDINIKSIKRLLNYNSNDTNRDSEIFFNPSRVLMQDFTGVPAIVDLAAMRDKLADLNKDPSIINPVIPVDLVIDHSVQVDSFGSINSYKENVEIEIKRNYERYKFLKWGQKSLKNFKVLPPGLGICHQMNLEYFAKVVFLKNVGDDKFLYFDTLVGTDSHTTMINGLSVIGWGVGGIEAEAAMLGQPLSLSVPNIVGCRLVGKLKEGVTATDVVLTVTEVLRKKGVVGKFVEFCGEGVTNLSLFDRATISNMSPEFGATVAYFPIDEKTLEYLLLTGRSEDHVQLVEEYAKKQGVWGVNDNALYNELVEIDLSSVEACVSGPKRPQDRIKLSDLKISEKGGSKSNTELLSNHDVVIAAITSCTNTSNPYVLVGAGLLAKNACKLGLGTKSWVKTSFAPGSMVVTDYLVSAGLMKYLERLGFFLVGYGCTTCIGNSGPLDDKIEKLIKENNLSVSAVLSGNRNFEGRVHPLVKNNYLASPMLCIVFAIAGTTNIDLLNDPIGIDKNNNKVYLKDIWPSDFEIKNVVSECLKSEMYLNRYKNIFSGNKIWNQMDAKSSLCYPWDKNSTYIAKPPFFEKDFTTEKLEGARILAIFGDSITTDHISPAGSIQPDHSAGEYLIEQGVDIKDFNSFGSRRGNDKVMIRGTFANVRIQNNMLKGKLGGYTLYHSDDGRSEIGTIYDVASKYKKFNVPVVVFAGKEYGTGSSRDWAAKGTKLLGVKAVIAESFERIHRSNLIGMGVLPLQVKLPLDFSIDGSEKVYLSKYSNVNPKDSITCIIKVDDNIIYTIDARVRIDTFRELEYFRNGGILNYVINQF